MIRCLLLWGLTMLVAAPVRGYDQQPFDWAMLDWLLDRPLLIRQYMFEFNQPGDAWASCHAAMAYRAEADSLGLAEFLALPAADRDRRRDLADTYRGVRDKVLRVISRSQAAGVSAAAQASQPGGLTEGGAALFPEFMGALINITGLVPDDPVAWYDLGFLASCVGDHDLQRRAFAAGEAAAARHTETSLPGLVRIRIRANLDEAWLCRDLGQLDRCLAAALRAAALMKEHEASDWMESVEARLVAGLAQAEAGNVGEARVMASPLADLPYWRRDEMAHATTRGPENMPYYQALLGRTAGGRATAAPFLPNVWRDFVPSQRKAWRERRSDWARNWVLAVALLREGDTAGALRLIEPLNTLTDYPAHLNHRFWNDKGLIYEMAGRLPEAQRAYSLAAVHHPFFIYYPFAGMRGVAWEPGGREQTGVYYLACGRFYTGGSLYAYAVNRVFAFELARDPHEALAAFALADEALTACRRRGIKPTAALALRGRLHFLAGNLQWADTDLRTAQAELAAAGRCEPDLFLMIGLVAFNGGDYAAARPWLEEFCGLVPERGIGWRALGLNDTYTGRLPEAEAAFDRALGVEPEHAGGWFNRALVRIKRGQRAGALSDLEEAARLAPDNPDVARVYAAIAGGPLPEMEIKPAAMRMERTAADTETLRRLQGRTAAVDPVLAFDAELTPELAAAMLPELEARHLRDPSAENAARYAAVALAAGEPRTAQRLLEGAWGPEASATSLRLLLAADRALGESDRARALVRNADEAARQWPDSELWALAAAICMDAGHAELGSRALRVVADLNAGEP